MTVGEALRSFRKKAGFTQEELAKKAGLATITIRQYETNKRTPNLNKLQQLSDALGVHPNDFFQNVTEYTIDSFDLHEKTIDHYYDPPLNLSDDSLKKSRANDICEQLNDVGLALWFDIGEGLTQVGKYKKVHEESNQNNPAGSLDDI